MYNLSRALIHRTRVWAGLMTVVAVILLGGGRSAHADNVDVLIKRLTASTDYKERLSAAINLAKIGDRRAVPAFLRALRDKDKTVRGVAAAGLGRLVAAGVTDAVRTRALAELKRVAAGDKNAFVRKQAQKSYDAIKRQGGGGAANARIFVQIGKMADSSGAGAAIVNAMRKTVVKTFRKSSKSIAVGPPGQKSPGKAALKGKAAFYVDGTLTQLSVADKGSSSLVSCKVSMLIATFPDKSMFGFLKGGASVQAGSSERDVGFAKEDCVAAVVEDLVKRKIIPTIVQRAP